MNTRQEDNLRVKPWLQRLSNICLLTLMVMVGPILFSLSILIAQAGYVGYDPISDVISILVLRSGGWVETVALIILGLVLMVFAVRLYYGVSKGMSSRIGGTLLAMVGVGFLLVGVFPTDPPGTGETLYGFIHGLVSRGIPLLFTVAVFLMGVSFRADSNWRKFSGYTIATGTLLLVLVALSLTMTLYSQKAGLYERLLLLVGFIWIEVIAARLLILCVRSPK